jgi:hypothetical protein
MTLADGDRPAEGDFWFRVLTNSKYGSNGRVHHSAFKGRFMGPPQPGRDWDAETSGRLRSLAGTKEEAKEHAVQYCATNNGVFSGYMIPDPHKPPIEGQVVEGLTLGIRYTPITGGDAAHADLTFTGPIPELKSPEHNKLLLELQDCFMAVHDNQWMWLPDAAIADPAPAQEQATATPQSEPIYTNPLSPLDGISDADEGD